MAPVQRFPSLQHAPSETRRVLRDRLQRFLGHEAQTMAPGNDAPEIADEDMLRLLQSLEFECGNEIANVTAAYEAAVPPGEDQPTFAELVTDGWFRVIWERVRVPREVGSALRRSDRTTDAVKAVLDSQFVQQTRLARTEGLSPELVALGQSLEAGAIEPHRLNCRSPAWVLARLWDRPSPQNGEATTLRRWSDLWNLLSPRGFVPRAMWGAHDAQRFRDGALQALETAPALEGWHETRERFLRELAVVHDRPIAAVQSSLPPVPGTLVDRMQWLEDNRVTRLSHESWMECEVLLWLFSLLAADLNAAILPPAYPAPPERLVDLVASRPDVLFYLATVLPERPHLLADLLLDPRTTALGCWLISQWRIGTGAFDREITTAGDERARTEAFEDAVAVLNWQLTNEASAPAEAGALLASLHRKAPAGFIDELNGEEPLRTALRNTLLDQSAACLGAMVEALMTRGDELRRAGSRFAASLELIAVGDIADQVDADRIVNIWIDGLIEDRLSPSVERIGVQSARALLAVASQRPELRARLLQPLDMGAELAKAELPEANPYTVNDQVAGALRAHIRVLCRAMAAQPENVPDDLAAALVSAVRSGSTSHRERNKVAAFAPRYERSLLGATRDRPIAADLAAALWSLKGDERQELLSAILAIDEPMVLAQLLPLAPPTTRNEISSRIEALPPTEAGSIQSLPEIQARIDELLSAGATEAAARFIEEEERVETLGRVQGRAVARLRSRVRLLFAQGQWDEVLHVQPPADLGPIEQQDANELLQLYRGLTLLLRPDQRAPEAAAQIFDELHRRQPNVAAYAVNRIAAQVGTLLPADLFGRISERDGQRARQILAESAALAKQGSLDRLNRRVLATNQATLHLALGEAEQALALLPVAAFEAVDERIQAYRAVALHRLGRTDEAIGLLNAASGTFGTTVSLDAARAQIREGAPFTGSAAVAPDDDPVIRIREAYSGLRRLDPIKQAQVLSEESDPLSAFLIGHVRGAAASVIALVSAMTFLSLDRREDDINSLVRQLLLSRLDFLRWSVSDQSKGGFTPKENPGERDIVVEEGTTTLAVIEALIAENPVRWETVQGNLRKHFQKLLAYAPCRLFFHLTYVYEQDVQEFIDQLLTIAERDAPAGYTFSAAVEIELTDTRPHGFVAQYNDGQGTIQVVFLVLNMGQGLLRAAAKASGRD